MLRYKHVWKTYKNILIYVVKANYTGTARTLKLCLPEKQKTSYTMSALEIYTFGVQSYRQFKEHQAWKVFSLSSGQLSYDCKQDGGIAQPECEDQRDHALTTAWGLTFLSMSAHNNKTEIYDSFLQRVFKRRIADGMSAKYIWANKLFANYVNGMLRLVYVLNIHHSLTSACIFLSLVSLDTPY
jgi:hypothetical protein